MTAPVQLGLRENLGQFSLLVLVNAFVGAMVGLERTVLPLLAEEFFGMASRTAIMSFIVSFGLAKAGMNYFAGVACDHLGRKRILVAGWLVGLPVPFLLIAAPQWSWVVVANVFLGLNQGMTWSTTVIMKIDLVGPRQRGLAMGLNEFAGYIAVALVSLVSGYIAATWGLRPYPFYLGIAFAFAGLIISVFFVRDTSEHALFEGKTIGPTAHSLSLRDVFLQTSFTDRNLSAVSQAGLVNNLNDGMAWGLFPLLFASAGFSLDRIGLLVALYPATWGIMQLFTGALSDWIGRKWLIVSGMWVQAGGIVWIAEADGFGAFAGGSILLGLGTAMVYPTLLAAIGDVAHSSWRASAVGVYRLWRDMGYAVGAFLSGAIADLFGLRVAMGAVAALTFASGVVVALRMRERTVYV